MEAGKDEQMSIKFAGALCIVVACSGCGMMMKAFHLRMTRRFQDLISVLEFMECELQYRCTPLPQLCRQAGEKNRGKIQEVFLSLADELEAQISPNVGRCMAAVLDRTRNLEIELKEILLDLGNDLGKFDLSGQIQGFRRSQKKCEGILKRLMQNQDSRLRSYQTLGLCAGAAIVILFM